MAVLRMASRERPRAVGKPAPLRSRLRSFLQRRAAFCRSLYSKAEARSMRQRSVPASRWASVSTTKFRRSHRPRKASMPTKCSHAASAAMRDAPALASAQRSPPAAVPACAGHTWDTSRFCRPACLVPIARSCNPDTRNESLSHPPANFRAAHGKYGGLCSPTQSRKQGGICSGYTYLDGLGCGG